MAIYNGFELCGRPRALPHSDESESLLYVFRYHREKNPSLLSKHASITTARGTFPKIVSGLEARASVAYTNRTKKDLEKAMTWAGIGSKIKSCLSNGACHKALHDIPPAIVERHDFLSGHTSFELENFMFKDENNTVDQLQDVALKANYLLIHCINVTGLYWEQYLKSRGVDISNKKSLTQKRSLAMQFVPKDKSAFAQRMANTDSHTSLSANIEEYRKLMSDNRTKTMPAILPIENAEPNKRQKIH